MSITVWVYDPRKGRDIPVSIQRKRGRGRTYVVELPEHLFPGSETPRRLEILAAVTELSSSTFGQGWTREGSPQNNIVRDQIPEIARGLSQPRQSRRVDRQRYLRSLLPPGLINAYNRSDSKRFRFFGEIEPEEEGGAATGPVPPSFLKSPRPRAEFPGASQENPAGRPATLPPRHVARWPLE